jgi:plasmid replication initiation protein
MVNESMKMATIKPKLPKIYKSKRLNNANFGDFTLNDYQVFLMLIAKLGKIDENGNYLQSEKLEREHTLTALEFAHHFNLDVKHAYTLLKKAGTKMMKSFITIEHPELSETWQIGITSFAKYNHKAGSITVEFSDRIMPYLAQVKQKFVLYNLKEIANFGSLYTTRLYELIQEFKDTGILLITVEKLRTAFAIGTKYTAYKDFKNLTFVHACNEINAKTDYNITFTEIKTGRKVTSVQFEFKKTIVEKRFKPDGSQVNNYIKPKHNSDKIESVKTIETPKKPAPAIAPRLKQKPSDVAAKTIEDLKTKFRVK